MLTGPARDEDVLSVAIRLPDVGRLPQPSANSFQYRSKFWRSPSRTSLPRRGRRLSAVGRRRGRSGGAGRGQDADLLLAAQGVRHSAEPITGRRHRRSPRSPRTRRRPRPSSARLLRPLHLAASASAAEAVTGSSAGTVGAFADQSSGITNTGSGGGATISGSTGGAGGGQPHWNIQPTTYCNYMIKL